MEPAAGGDGRCHVDARCDLGVKRGVSRVTVSAGFVWFGQDPKLDSGMQMCYEEEGIRR